MLILRRDRLGTAGVAILCLVVAALFVLKIRDSANDDFFITYRYAANVAAGNGLVFNVGERVFGITEPGQALLLGALAAVTRAPVPWLGTVVTAMAILGLCALLARERSGQDGAASALSAALLASSSYLWVNNGCGGLLATVALLAAARLAPRLPRSAGVLAGVAVWSDGFAGAIGWPPASRILRPEPACWRSTRAGRERSDPGTDCGSPAARRV